MNKLTHTNVPLEPPWTPVNGKAGQMVLSWLMFGFYSLPYSLEPIPSSFPSFHPSLRPATPSQFHLLSFITVTSPDSVTILSLLDFSHSLPTGVPMPVLAPSSPFFAQLQREILKPQSHPALALLNSLPEASSCS